jgi:hypothetical protein
MSIDSRKTLLEIVNHILTQHEDVRVSTKRILDHGSPTAERMAGLGIDELFPIFTPKSGGTALMRASATIDAINDSFPLLASLAHAAHGKSLSITELESAFTTDAQRERTQKLEIELNSYGSDKASTHAYHHFYANAFDEPDGVLNVLEIGLGTNNVDVLSSMGPTGRPGASLRAFRNFFSRAEMHGCDVDARILFTEERIRTFEVNQTLPETFLKLPQEFSYDLMIDDGLHSPHANLASLTYFLGKIRKGGWAVVEDIGIEALPIWQTVHIVLPPNFESVLYKSRHTNSMLFGVRKLS